MHGPAFKSCLQPTGAGTGRIDGCCFVGMPDLAIFAHVEAGKSQDDVELVASLSKGLSDGFQILRLTVKKRMRATLLAIRDELKRLRHEPIRARGQWLTRVVCGYFNYHDVPGNLKRLSGFRKAICRYWRQALGRRSQRNRLQWSRFGLLTNHYIPDPKNAHPYPEDRFASRTQGRSRMR